MVLPTGAGKTLIAAETAVRLHHTGKTLFLVPTVLLVSQQAGAVKLWSTNLVVKELIGGNNLEGHFDVLVATPKAFEERQKRDDQLSWGNFGLLVFDEVHHVLKQHPYR